MWSFCFGPCPGGDKVQGFSQLLKTWLRGSSMQKKLEPLTWAGCCYNLHGTSLRGLIFVLSSIFQFVIFFCPFWSRYWMTASHLRSRDWRRNGRLTLNIRRFPENLTTSQSFTWHGSMSRLRCDCLSFSVFLIDFVYLYSMLLSWQTNKVFFTKPGALFQVKFLE